MIDVSGTQLRSYEVRRKIAEGGFGAVYYAFQSLTPPTGREVAIKVIRPHFAALSAFIRRFEAEAQTIARLEHPHIVPLYDFWRDPSGAYLVMRWFSGGTLADALKRGPLPLPRVTALFDQLAAALTFAHARGVVHRDLKPANILMDTVGYAYLADFGIAVDHSGPNTTLSEVRACTPGYAAPEQLLFAPATPQSDIYSLAVILYELLTGTPAFSGATPDKIAQQQLAEWAPNVREHNPDAPAALDAILRRATTRDPHARYADALQFATAVRHVLGPFDAPAAAHHHATVLLDLPDRPNPYKGLRAFQEADAADFFGRTTLTNRLLDRLTETGASARFLTVVGPSGSGKSSVVRAGLIPAVRSGRAAGTERWFIVDCTLDARPLEALEQALLRVATHPPANLQTLLREHDHGLMRAVERVLPPDETIELVLVIDQFEELFTRVTDEALRVHLLTSIVTALSDPRSRLRVVITLRADCYDRPLHYAAFGELLRRHTEVALPLTTEELEQAIVAPAQRAGVSVEPALVVAMIDDVNAQPGALPLAQYALTELFEQRSERNLTLAAYRANGGVRGALARRAEALYRALEPTGQAAARQLFLRLITPGDGNEDTRRRIRRAALAMIGQQLPDADGVNTDRAALDEIIELYGRHRLLTFDHDPATREPTVEIAHEALIQSWQRLREWLDTVRADLRVQRRLAAAATEWAAHGHDPSYLAAGSRLAHFTALGETGSIALNAEEQTYLDASIREHTRQEAAERERRQRELTQAQALVDEQRQRAEAQAAANRRLRMLFGVVCVFLLAVSGLTLFAFQQRNQAEQNAAAAQRVALTLGAQAALGRGAADEALVLALAVNEADPADPRAELILSQAADAASTQRRFTGHTDAVRSVVVSPDGRTALSGAADGAIRLWDVANGQELRRLEGHTDDVFSVVFSPDGRTALSGSLDGSLRLWDSAGGQELRRFTGHTEGVLSVAFSPDGRTALSGSLDGAMRLWDVASGQELRRFDHPDWVWSVAFSPDGRTALSGARDHSVRLWDLSSGQELRRFQGHTGDVLSVAFSTDGATALSGSWDHTLRLWDVTSGQELRRFTGHTNGVHSVAFSPDGRAVLSGSLDRTLRLWDLASGQELRRFQGHTGEVFSVAFVPDGQRIISGALDQTLRLWDVTGSQELRRLSGHTSWVWDVAFSPDGSAALSGGQDYTLRLWDVASGQEARRFEGHTDWVWSVAFSPDGQQAVSGARDKTLRLWDVASGQELRRFEGHTGDVFSVAFSPDGQTIASGAHDGAVRLWDSASGQELRRFEGHIGEVFSVVFSPDGQSIASGSQDATVRLWDVASGQELRRFDGHTEIVRSVAFSPDGRTILSGSHDRTLRLWDVASGQELRRFTGHTDWVWDAAFSADGTRLLSGSRDRTLRLWDVTGGQERRRFTGHLWDVSSVALHPNGRMALTGSPDTTVRLWRIDPLGEWTAWLRVNRYVPELTCEQRALYRLEPLCAATTATAQAVSLSH